MAARSDDDQIGVDLICVLGDLTNGLSPEQLDARGDSAGVRDVLRGVGDRMVVFVGSYGTRPTNPKPFIEARSARGTTYTTATEAPSWSASSTPTCTAWFAAAEPSVAIKILFIV